MILSITECGQAQPEPAQVFCPSGECEGSRLDRGRAGIHEEETAEAEQLVGDEQAPGHSGKRTVEEGSAVTLEDIGDEGFS